MSLRIVFCVEAFFPKAKGAAYAAHRLARALHARGHEVSFVVDERGQGWRGGGVFDGFHVQSFTTGSPGKLKRARGLVAFMAHMWRCRNTWDLFHVHGGCYMTITMAWLVHCLLRKKVLLKVTSCGADTPDGVRRGKYGWLMLPLYRRLDALVTMTAAQADICRARGFRGTVATIPNGVDCQRFRPVIPEEQRRLRAENGLPVDRQILVYAGWLGHGKGVDILFRVWAELRRRGVDVVLLCVGNFLPELDARPKLKRYLQERGVDPSLADSPDLHLVGRVENIEQYLQMSDIFIFPSRQEGFGTVQIEAMACGLACVVNDLPGITSEIFPGEDLGIRVQDNQRDAFVAAIEDLVRNPDKRETLGFRARHHAVKHFAADSVADRYAALYAQLLAPSAEGSTP